MNNQEIPAGNQYPAGIIFVSEFVSELSFSCREIKLKLNKKYIDSGIAENDETVVNTRKIP